MTKKRKTAYLVLIANVVLWGLAAPVTKRAFADGLKPEVFLFWRYIVAIITTLPVIFWVKNWRWNQTLVIAGHELIGSVATLWLFYSGLALTSAVSASLISSTWPFFVTLGGVWWLREKETSKEWKGLALALLGTLLLTSIPLIKDGRSGSFIGNTLILTQNIIWTVYLLLIKKKYQNISKWQIAFTSFVLSAVVFGLISVAKYPVTQILLPLNILSISYWPMISVVYMGLFGSTLALTCYLIGQDKIEASEAAVFTYLQPLVAIPASIIILKEGLSVTSITAMIIIAWGVFITEKR